MKTPGSTKALSRITAARCSAFRIHLGQHEAVGLLDQSCTNPGRHLGKTRPCLKTRPFHSRCNMFDVRPEASSRERFRRVLCWGSRGCCLCAVVWRCPPRLSRGASRSRQKKMKALLYLVVLMSLIVGWAQAQDQEAEVAFKWAQRKDRILITIDLQVIHLRQRLLQTILHSLDIILRDSFLLFLWFHHTPPLHVCTDYEHEEPHVC
jgi:hypothetical protein